MEYVDSETNKVMAMVIIQSIMKNNTQISTADKVGFCPLYIYIYVYQVMHYFKEACFLVIWFYSHIYFIFNFKYLIH